MKSVFRKLLFTLIAPALVSVSAVAGEFFIKDGDRVVFLGDSITEQRLYTTYIEAYALTRHPEWKLWFRNVGWAGTPPGCASGRIRMRGSFLRRMKEPSRRWLKIPSPAASTVTFCL